MADFTNLQRNAIKVKPASKRAARQKSSFTPDDVFRLNYNESPYGASPKAMAALAKACEKPFQYPDWFSAYLKDEVAAMYGLEQGSVVPGSGSSAMICMLGEIFLNEGDEVILGDPSYEAFRDVAHDYGATPVMIPLDENMTYDLDAMLMAITPKTKMIVVCNPNNPTGTFIDSDKLAEFLDKIPKTVLTVVDEAYLEFVTRPNTYSMIEYLKKHYEKPIIVLKTFSKIYGMAGVRMGYGVMSLDLAACMGKSSHAWNVSRLGQIMAVEALKDQDFIKDIQQKNLVERTKVSDALKEMGCKVYDSEANFILFKCALPSAEVQAKLAENKVLIGAPVGCLRVSIGLPEMNEKFIMLMKEILGK